MDNRELEELKWSQYKNRPSVEFEEEDDFLQESLDILDRLEERSSHGSDVINWEEKAEMDKVTQRNPGISVVEEDDGQEINENNPDPQHSQRQSKSNGAANQQEQDAMDYLAGVMGELENYDGKQ